MTNPEVHDASLDINESRPDFLSNVFEQRREDYPADMNWINRDKEILKEVGLNLLYDETSCADVKQSITRRFSREDIALVWEQFVNEFFASVAMIVDELKIVGEGVRIAVEITYKDSNSHYADQTAKGTLYKVRLSERYLLIHFYHYITDLKKRNSTTSSYTGKKAVYSIVSSLAHEFHHVRQVSKFPGVNKKELDRHSYHDRLTEYAAELYALKFLRKLKPQSLSDKLAHNLVRAQIAMDIHFRKAGARKRLDTFFSRSGKVKKS